MVLYFFALKTTQEYILYAFSLSKGEINFEKRCETFLMLLLDKGYYKRVELSKSRDSHVLYCFVRILNCCRGSSKDLDAINIKHSDVKRTHITLPATTNRANSTNFNDAIAHK